MEYVNCKCICINEKDSDKVLKLLKENNIEIKGDIDYVSNLEIKQEVEYRINEIYKDEMDVYIKENNITNEEIIDKISDEIYNNEDGLFDSLTDIIDENIEELLDI